MALSSRMQSIMAGVACGRSARQRREMDVGTQLAVSFFFQSRTLASSHGVAHI